MFSYVWLSTSVCVMCLWRWISAVFFMWVLFCDVFQHGLFRTVFICWDFIMFWGMAYAGVEGKWYEFMEKQGFCLMEGNGIGGLWLLGLGKASNTLLLNMLCSWVRWLFLWILHICSIIQLRGGGCLCYGIVGSASCCESGQINVIFLRCVSIIGCVAIDFKCTFVFIEPL